MSRGIRIGVDCLFADPKRTFGTWVFAKSLVEEITSLDAENEYFVFVNSLAARDFYLERPNVRFITSHLVGWTVGARLVYQNLLLPFLTRWHGLDLLHSLGSYGPLWPLVRSVVTVHDVRPFFDREPGYECGPRGRVAGLDFLMRQSLRGADRIAVVSEFTRRGLVARYPFTAEKIRVIHEGLPRRRTPICIDPADVDKVLARHGVRRPYVLAVGLSLPHKNIERLIEAFARLKREPRILRQLVLVGEAGANRGNLLAAVRQCGVQDDIVFTGFVDDGELAALYASAELFVFPSMMEGFGLPLLEAMANRTPVVCSNAGSLPEVAGDGALLFDPLDVGDMARAIREVLESPALRARLVACGLKRVELFSFRRAAEATLELYNELLHSKSGLDSSADVRCLK
jgi:glycosyltransferase involved in cell wall biosynthesis